MMMYAVIIFTACNSHPTAEHSIKSFDSLVTNAVTIDEHTITFPSKAKIVSVETVQSDDRILADEYWVIVNMYNHRYLYHIYFAGDASRESAVMIQ